MVTKQDVLELIAERSREGKPTSFRTLVREFDLSEEAACDHLRRLWQQRLIETSQLREPEFRFRLTSGESVRELRFEIARKGRARLRWWRKQAAGEAEGWPW